MQISQNLLRSPERIIILGFLFLILTGACLLVLPQTSTIGGLGFADALFTSTSAVCVTGLTVVDTGTAFNLLGQFILIILIQIGGLGIMTISTLILIGYRGRSSFFGYNIIQNTFNPNQDQSPGPILQKICFFTLLLESSGALLLLFCFFPDNEMPRALYLAIFHSISAFCNAGFSLFPDSFIGYQDNWVVNLTICFLVITGGIGFVVLSEFQQLFSRKNRLWSQFSFHTKLVLFSTASLLIVSTIAFFFMERHNTLAQFSVQHSLLASFFQAVNTRTSGFNTLQIGNMANETLFVFIILMFIGASPGSCAGGIKTTSFATLILLGISRLRGQSRPQIFKRSISEKSIAKATSVLMVSSAVVCIGIIILLMSELGDVSHPQSRGKFLEICFEVVSAFGTVGLSTGITTKMTIIGKMIISCVMFIGRLGPLVIGIAVSRSVTSHYYNAHEDIMIG